MEQTFENGSFISNNKTIRSSVYRSPNSNKWIVFSHGFTGHRIGPGYLFVSIARNLTEQGYNVLAFDFSGCGESEGQFCDMTIENLCDDLQNAVEFVRSTYTPEKLLFLGHSFGGMITAIMGDKLNADGIILLSPVADVEKHVLGHSSIFTGDNRENGLYSIGPFTLKMEFLESFKKSTPVITFCSMFKNPVIIIQGEDDTTITKEESYLYVKESKNRQMDLTYKLIKNGDHNFSDVDQRDILITEIVKWIKEKII